MTDYKYKTSTVKNNKADGSIKVSLEEQDYKFKIDLKVPKVGVMLVGFGGNNGSTLLASILANKHNISFHNKDGEIKPNYLGSMTQSATVHLGRDEETGRDFFQPFNAVLPMVNPNDLIVTGWDISNLNLAESMQRAQVLDYDLQRQLTPLMKEYTPMKSIYYPEFIAANQFDRANNCINSKGDEFTTKGKWDHMMQVRSDIKTFKTENQLDKVIVLWTANTEKFAQIVPGVNDTHENLLQAIKNDHEEIAPSTLFAVASILEGVPYINGSPQNTFVPGLIKLAEHENVLIAGDDFKTGQTKLKSVLTQFLVDAGIRPVSIASYNHLGNNDGKNLSSQMQFKSKEISKSGVINDILESNSIMYGDDPEKARIDHCIVIKYMPAVGDSKVAMDEYYNELMLGGHNRISLHNVCEDSLLAAPIILDLVIMCEFCSRVTYKEANDNGDYKKFHPVLTLLSYWLKAPLAREDFLPVNGLMKQRAALENFMRLLIGLPANDELRFEERLA